MIKKLFVTGLTESIFIKNIYSGFTSKEKSIEIVIGSYNNVDMDYYNSRSATFNEIKYFKEIFPFKIFALKKFFRIPYNKIMKFTFIYYFFGKNSFFEAIKFLLLQFNFYFHIKHIEESKNIKNFSFHFMKPLFVFPIFYINEKKKIVCSFWGSDLMRTSGTYENYFISEALKKADVITTQSLETKEIILSKFGRYLESKIKIIYFPLNQKIFNFIDKFINEKEVIKTFKIQNNIPIDKKVIVIGHNGYEDNNHLKIIESFNKIDEKDKNSIVFVMPWTYGGNKSYKEHIKKFVNNLNIEIIFIEKYLKEMELALLRIITEYFIMAPKSDAQSATFLEVLYAGGMCIAGDWLFYGNYRRTKLKFIEINTFREISKSILSKRKLTEIEIKKNREIIKREYLNPNIVHDWYELYT